jgi:hypothetical protein
MRMSAVVLACFFILPVAPEATRFDICHPGQRLSWHVLVGGTVVVVGAIRRA